MKLLDSDMVTLLNLGHPRVVERALAETALVATTVITRVEVLRGRFDALLKAVDGTELQRAQRMLEQSERALAKLVTIPVDAAGAAEFDRLRENKKLKKIGRADLLIASIALAHRATVVTRNRKHFRQVPGLDVENWAD
jgi:tRNA(fMet)-specific endonuclease VapC